MKICHLSDIHVGSEEHFDRDVLLAAIDEINGSDADLVLNTGDLTNSGRAEEFSEAKELLDGIDKPRIAIPGNHDARSGGIALFMEYIGATEGVREFGDAVIIHTDSTVPDTNDGRLGMVSFERLKNALNEYSHKPLKIVMIHHHIVPIPMAGRERNVLINAGDVLDLLLRYDVDLVLSGHRHYPNSYEVENCLFINAGTLSCKKTRYGDVNSYNMIEIEGDTRTVTTRRVSGISLKRKFCREKDRIFSNLGKREFRIVQLANSRISRSSSFLKKHMSNAIKRINGFEPNVVVHCGGVVKEGVPSDYLFAEELMGGINAPILYSPAGRDINYLGYHLFPESFGPFDQTYSEDDVVIRGISSAQYDSTKGVIGESDRWVLMRELENREEMFKGVCLHHKVIPTPHSREKGLLEDSGYFLRQLVDNKIDLVMTGTSSFPYAVKVEDTVVVNANSVSSIYQRSIYGNSFNLIDIFQNAIAVSEINSLWGTRSLRGIWRRISCEAGEIDGSE